MCIPEARCRGRWTTCVHSGRKALVNGGCDIGFCRCGNYGDGLILRVQDQRTGDQGRACDGVEAFQLPREYGNQISEDNGLDGILVARRTGSVTRRYDVHGRNSDRWRASLANKGNGYADSGNKFEPLDQRE